MRRIAILAALVAFGLASRSEAEQGTRVITVVGEGQVEAVPDMAMITLGVTHEASEAVEAMEQVSQRTANILDRLTTLEVDPTDVQTSRFSLNPVWSNRNSSTGARPEISGFAASNAVTVRVRELTSLGQILDAVIADGANTFNGLQFLVQDPKPLQDEARRRATADAMDRAAQLAKAAGVTLGSVQSISELGGGAQPVRMEMAAMRDGGVPIAAGEVSMTASVSMVFEILD